jgi:hypothetical protein
MRPIVSIDGQGVRSVDIESTPDERQQAHSLFAALRPEIERLGKVAEAAGQEIVGGGDEKK